MRREDSVRTLFHSCLAPPQGSKLCYQSVLHSDVSCIVCYADLRCHLGSFSFSTELSEIRRHPRLRQRCPEDEKPRKCPRYPDTTTSYCRSSTSATAPFDGSSLLITVM